MATKRIKDISTTATTFAADDFIALDASSVGTRKMAKASLITQVGANYLEKADNLSDVASKDTAKLNLEVPNVGTAANEVSVNGMLGDLAFQSSAGVVVDDLTVDGELTAAVGKPTSVNGPSMHFDGSAYVTITSDSRLSFEGSGNDLPFTFACWTKLPASSPVGTVFFSKWVSAAEYSFQTNIAGNLQLYLSDGTNTPDIKASTALPTEKWVHVCGTYSGTSGGAFSTAANGLTLYVNGEAVTATQTNKAAYSGMKAGSDALQISRIATTNYEQTIRDARIFNKELSAAEVREVYSNGQLGFAESTGGALGGVETSDFSAGTDSWLAAAGAVAGNIDAIGGQDDNLRFTCDNTTATHAVYQDILTAGKRYRIDFDYYIPSGQSNIDGLVVIIGTSNAVTVGTESSPTLGAWNRFSAEAEVTATGNADRLIIYAADGGATTFTDAGGDDLLYLRNIRVTQIGSVLDARAEQFDTSTGKLYDLSGNSFVGTQSGGVSLLGRKFPVYETGSWTPSITFGNGSTGLTLAASEGVYTRVGNIAYISGFITLSAKGSSTGAAVITGLPFTAKLTLSSYQSVAFSRVLNMAGLSSAVDGNINGNATTISLNDTGATGASSLDEANFTDTTTVRFSATYQIQ